MASFFLFPTYNISYMLAHIKSFIVIFLKDRLKAHTISTYNKCMKTTPAQKRAHQKYQHEKVDTIFLRVPKGVRQIVQERAASLELSVNSYVNQLIEEDLKRKR